MSERTPTSSRLPSGSRCGKTRDQTRAHDPVHADHPVLGLGRLARAHVREVLAQRRLVVLVHRAAPAREHVAPRRPAEQPRDAGVDVARAQVAVGRALELEEDVVDGLDEARQALARVAQLVGDAAALGDVEADAVHLDGAVRRRASACTRSRIQRTLPSSPTSRYSSSADSREARRVAREELDVRRAVVGMHRRLPGILGPLVGAQGAAEDALDARARCTARDTRRRGRRCPSRGAGRGPG